MFRNATIIHQENYIIIKQLVSPDICQLLADYAKFNAKIKPYVLKSDDPISGVHRKYGDMLMETLLEKLTPLIEKATGLELWPTLSFYYTYQQGHKFKAHKDRSSLQYVAGLCVGADEEYKKNNATSWPLIFNIHGKAHPVELDYGDMVIFRGHEIEHWREVFNGQWFVSAIFGYVDKNGPFAFQKYDQRKTLGKPHVGMFRWLWGCLFNQALRILKH